MLRQIDEGVVFVTTGADNAHHGLSFAVSKPEVGAVASASWYLLHIGRLLTSPLSVKF
jgi:hypothetical protein